MPIEIHTFIRTTTMSLPIAGRLSQIPTVGQVSHFPRDVIDNWPNEHEPAHRIKRDESRTRIVFSSDTFRTELGRLNRELGERSEALTSFRQRHSDNMSWQPIEDPFLPFLRYPGFETRVQETKALLVALLLDAKIATLVSQVPAEPYLELESRIRELLPTESLQFCASLTGLSNGDIKLLAGIALAEELRGREGVHTPEIENPSAPFQTVRINDPILYAGHTATSSVEAFENRFLAYISAATDYWEKVGKNNLYNADDIRALIKWRVAPDPNMPFFKKFGSPKEALAAALADWHQVKEEINTTYKIVNRIATLGMGFWLNNWPLPATTSSEEKGIWIAKQAVTELGLPPEWAAGHTLTWGLLGDFLLKYFLLDYKSTITKIPVVDTASRLEAIAKFIVPSAVNHLISTQMSFKIKLAFGGTKLQFNWFVPRQEITDELSELDIAGGVSIINGLLRDPRNFDEQLFALREWRLNFEAGLSRHTVNDPERIIGFYNNMFEMASSDAEAIHGALSNVDSINEIQQTIEAILQRLNTTTIGNGNVDLPADTRVVAVFAKEGEYLAEGRPVLSVRDRFRCNARAFLTTDELTSLDLTVMSVWKVAVDFNKEAAPGFPYVAIITRIEPDRKNSWMLDIELFAVFEVAVNGVANLPQYLPVSERYVGGIHKFITNDTLDAVERAFSTFSFKTLKLLDRVH